MSRARAGSPSRRASRCCLDNQETAEHPQLYFSHQLKSGDAYQLAHEIRLGLNHTRSE